MKGARLFPILLGVVAYLLTVEVAFAASIHVFAAASLNDSLKEIAALYEKQSGHKVIFNFGASSLLARQIEESAPADIFFSADEAKMDQLEKKGLIVKETRKSPLSNSLVIVTASDNVMPIRSAHDLTLSSIRRIALAETRTVPAGIYAKAYLEKAGLWNALQKKVVPTENVRAALSAVEAGNVEAGIVYKTDASISKKVKIACAVPVSDGPAISYPVALMKEAKEAGAARDFLKFLEAEKAREVFERFGFIVR
jgi:molybdate transport system substrate-binding protein